MKAIGEAHRRVLLHLVALAMALVAVATMPVCIDASNAPILHGDVLTITESRDVVEVMHEPGMHLLHVQRGAEDRCSSCEPMQSDFETPFVANADDQTPRVAALPSSVAMGSASDRAVGAMQAEATASLSTRPFLPPPRPNS